jgi:hypothetical protein
MKSHDSRILTAESRTLSAHIKTNVGMKTVCVTTCLTFLGVPVDSYEYTHIYGKGEQWTQLLEANGYELTDIRKGRMMSVTEARKMITSSGKYGPKDYFVISACRSRDAHLMVLDGRGRYLINTAKGARFGYCRNVVHAKKLK